MPCGWACSQQVKQASALVVDEHSPPAGGGVGPGSTGSGPAPPLEELLEELDEEPVGRGLSRFDLVELSSASSSSSSDVFFEDFFFFFDFDSDSRGAGSSKAGALQPAPTAMEAAMVVTNRA